MINFENVSQKSKYKNVESQVKRIQSASKLGYSKARSNTGKDFNFEQAKINGFITPTNYNTENQPQTFNGKRTINSAGVQQ